MRYVIAKSGAGKACDASHSGAMRKEHNAANAAFGKNPEGTGYLGVLLRCVACQGDPPWRRATPCTTSQIAAFVLTDMYEMSSSHDYLDVAVAQAHCGMAAMLSRVPRLPSRHHDPG